MRDSKILKIKHILEIVDAKFMQNVQDFFAKTLDIALISVYKNDWLTDSSNNIDFCRKYIRRSKMGYSRCEACHREWEKTVIENPKPTVFKCHAGLTNFCIPVTIEGKYMACVIGGQVLTEKPDKKHFKQIAKELDIVEDDYMAEIKKIRILPKEKVQAAVDLLYLVTNSVASLAYINRQLADLGMDYKIPRNLAMEEWFFKAYGDVKRPISSREFEILKLIVLGKSNAQIAKELFISSHTVKAHVSSIIEKFEVKDRVQVAVKAVREGWV